MGTPERSGAEAVTRDTVVTRETLNDFLLQVGLSTDEAEGIVTRYGHVLFGHVGNKRLVDRQLRAVDVETQLFVRGQRQVADLIREKFSSVGAPQGVAQETVTEGISERVSGVFATGNKAEAKKEGFNLDTDITEKNFGDLLEWAGVEGLSSDAIAMIWFSLQEQRSDVGSLGVWDAASLLAAIDRTDLCQLILDKLSGVEKE